MLSSWPTLFLLTLLGNNEHVHVWSPPCQSLQAIKGNIGASSSERLPGTVPWCWSPGASQHPPLFFRSCHICFTCSILMLWSLLPGTVSPRYCHSKMPYQAQSHFTLLSSPPGKSASSPCHRLQERAGFPSMALALSPVFPASSFLLPLPISGRFRILELVSALADIHLENEILDKGCSQNPFHLALGR